LLVAALLVGSDIIAHRLVNIANNLRSLSVQNDLILNASFFVRAFMKTILFLLPKKFHSERIIFCKTQEELSTYVDYEDLPGVMLLDGTENR